MTSFPGPGDLLRSLLPGQGRGGPGPGAGQGPGDLDLGDVPRGPLYRGPGAERADLLLGPGAFRGDAMPALSPADASRLADTLSHVMRQNPSHPLYRELTHLPPDTVRQLIQFVNLHAPNGREIPQHVGDALLQAAGRGAGDGRGPAPAGAAETARGAADAAARMAPQGQAQATGQGGPADARMVALAREGMPLAPERRGEDARWPAPGMATNPRPAATGNGLEAGPALPPTRPDPVLPARQADAAGTLANTPAGTAPQGPAPVASAPHEAQQALAARAGEVALPVRTESAVPAPPGNPVAVGAGEPSSPGGLPGLAGAAGLTMAAVGNPAGTTHAHAPDAAVRARKADERAAGIADTGRTRRRKARGNDAQAGARDNPRGSSSGRGHGDRGLGQGAGEAEARPGRHASATAGGHAGAAIPAASHTHGAATTCPAGRPGKRDDGATGDAALAGQDPPARQGTAAATAASSRRPDSEARPATQPVPHDDQPEPTRERHARGMQWLYWSLIVVTYGCLGVALASMSPDRFGLPLGTAAATGWRNALTATGLLTGLLAWLLARRMR